VSGSLPSPSSQCLFTSVLHKGSTPVDSAVAYVRLVTLLVFLCLASRSEFAPSHSRIRFLSFFFTTQHLRGLLQAQKLSRKKQRMFICLRTLIPQAHVGELREFEQRSASIMPRMPVGQIVSPSTVGAGRAPRKSTKSRARVQRTIRIYRLTRLLSRRFTHHEANTGIGASRWGCHSEMSPPRINSGATPAN